MQVLQLLAARSWPVEQPADRIRAANRRNC